MFEITRVKEFEEEIEILHWRVQTGQGERRFQSRLDDWPPELPGGGLLIRDVAGHLYRLADAEGWIRRAGRRCGRLWTD